MAVSKPVVVVKPTSGSGLTVGDRSAKSILGVFFLLVTPPNLRFKLARLCKMCCSEGRSAVDP